MFVEAKTYLIVSMTESIVVRTSGAALQTPSTITLSSNTKGIKHFAHSPGKRPIYQI
jgi:hypothetical protein